ncbi:MAG TPA: WG repeat-containing protein [Candidatus Rifleibacterium sp.]|nr:WG repeat-containing protein [Candidatus Rifleibacterium sp.]
MKAKWRLPLFLLTAIFYCIPGVAQQTNITFADNRAYITFEGIDDWEFKPVQVGDKFGFSTELVTGKWGTTSPSGKVEIYPLFDKVCRFVNGYAAVKLDGLWGVIDISACFVIKPAWEKVWSPANDGHPGELTMRFSGDGVDSNDLYEVDPLEDWTNGFNPGVFPLRKDNAWHLINADGDQLSDTAYPELMTMACDRAAAIKDNLWGFLGPDGLPAVPFQFTEVSNFSEGLAAVRKDNFWGYIDVNGKTAILEQFDQAEEFASGTAIVVAKGNYGIINQAGNFLVKPEFPYINKLPESDLFMVCTNFKAGLFHRKSGMIMPPVYDNCKVLPDGNIIATLDGQQGLFDLEGKVMLPLAPRNLSCIGESIILSTDETSLALYNPADKSFVERDYLAIKPFSDGRAAFQNREGMWGFLDKNLNEVIPADFTWVTDFKGSQAATENASGVTIIDLNRQPVSKQQLDLHPIKDKPGWSRLSFQNRQGIMDEQNRILLRPEFSIIQVFSTGVMLAKRDVGWVMLAAENSPASNQTYEEAGNVLENRCWVKSGGKVGFIDQHGHVVIPLQYEAATDMRVAKPRSEKASSGVSSLPMAKKSCHIFSPALNGSQMALSLSSRVKKRGLCHAKASSCNLNTKTNQPKRTEN